VKYLARTVPFDLDVLRDRYEKELRPILGNPGCPPWPFRWARTEEKLIPEDSIAAK
jgi:hypothetical protein